MPSWSEDPDTGDDHNEEPETDPEPDNSIWPFVLWLVIVPVNVALACILAIRYDLL